jgi:hypothetical protein
MLKRHIFYFTIKQKNTNFLFKKPIHRKEHKFKLKNLISVAKKPNFDDKSLTSRKKPQLFLFQN